MVSFVCVYSDYDWLVLVCRLGNIFVLLSVIVYLLFFSFVIIYLLAVYINYYCITTFLFLLTFIRLKLILWIQVSETTFYLNSLF